MHLHEAVMHAHLNDQTDTDIKGPMIQMQTYTRSRTAKKGNRRSMDPNSEAGRALNSSNPAVRQREPRENSDFLRVIVLEMNMRRGGKLDAKAQGRARIWLPPRKGGRDDDEIALGAGRVPERWVGVAIDDLD